MNFFDVALFRRRTFNGFLTGLVFVLVGNGFDSFSHRRSAHSQETSADDAISFRNDVLSIFAKKGCNSGACHGALAGKGGFKLSLRGYDPIADYRSVAIEARGRRIESSDPGRSLILAKPSGGMAHKGGLRFEVGSPDYNIIADWIAQGAPAPSQDDPRVVRIEAVPAQASMLKGESYDLAVRAHYSDGQVRDVTRWSKFDSVDLTVASVDEQGHVGIVGPGEGAVTAWFASKIVIARASVPYADEMEEDAFQVFTPRNFIDNHVLAKLKELRIPPSPQSEDVELLRRTYLDTIGVLPSPDEVRAYLANDAENKREELIDTLLARPEFVDYWTYKWSDVLLINGRRLNPAPVKAYYQFIRRHVERNTAWNEFAAKVITAQGETLNHGATNFYKLHPDPEAMTENLCQAFLGLSIGCAKCHNHPLEKWTNDQYYAMASFFARVRSKSAEGDGDTILVSSSGELLQPRTGKPQPPTPLDGEPLASDATGDRRWYVAEWITSPENPYFTRAIANRVWANFLNVGLVEQVDDLRLTNPASNEALLAALADHLVEHEFDVKELMRTILNSATYARSSSTLPGNAVEKRFYARYYPRRMMAEVLLDAISQVTDVPTAFTHIAFANSSKKETEFYPTGTRALQLFDAAVASDFLKSFGRNPRNITCECERSAEPTMVQVFHLANGETVQGKLKAEGNRIEQLLAADVPAYKMIEELYLAALSRYPTDDELGQLLPLVINQDGLPEREVIEDLFWSVLSSREFLFNH